MFSLSSAFSAATFLFSSAWMLARFGRHDVDLGVTKPLFLPPPALEFSPRLITKEHMHTYTVQELNTHVIISNLKTAESADWKNGIAGLAASPESGTVMGGIGIVGTTDAGDGDGDGVSMDSAWWIWLLSIRVRPCWEWNPLESCSGSDAVEVGVGVRVGVGACIGIGVTKPPVSWA